MRDVLAIRQAGSVLLVDVDTYKTCLARALDLDLDNFEPFGRSHTFSDLRNSYY
jgi:hypothetical protein